jgi:uncharacterized membrane protein YkvI
MIILELAFLFVGSIIGAGFATGAEISTFFSSSNSSFWVAVFVALGLSALIIISIYVKLNKKIFLPVYFVLFIAMTAGIGEIAGVFGSAVSLILTALIVRLGFEKLSKINFFIIVAIIGVLLFNNFEYTKIDFAFQFDASIIWALLYSGLNCCMLGGIISSAKAKYGNKTIIVSAVAASLIIAFFVLLILNAIKINNAEDEVMPLFAINHNFITFFVILLAILTSQMSALWTIKENCKININLISLLCFFCSLIGFHRLISWFYPLVGAAVLLYLPASWIVAKLRSRHLH